jgi:hypothetical protein
MSSLIIPTEYHWKHRAVRETGGNTSLMGCFVLAICGWQHGRHPPRFGSTATINKDGVIIAHMQTKEGTIFPNQQLGQVQTVIDNFRGLADHLKLNDDERIEMFTELKKWFVKDERANQNAEERGLVLK